MRVVLISCHCGHGHEARICNCGEIEIKKECDYCKCRQYGKPRKNGKIMDKKKPTVH